MKIRNLLRIFSANLRLAFSDLMFRLTVTVLLMLVAATFVAPLVGSIISDPASSNLFDAYRDLVILFFKGDNLSEATHTLSEANRAFSAMLSGYMSEIVWVSVGVVAIIVVLMFFFGLADCALVKTVDGYMSTLRKMNYFRAVFSDFGKTFVVQFINAVISFVLGGGLMIGVYFLFVFIVDYISLLALPLSVLVLAAGMGIIRGMLSSFMPSAFGGKKIGQALAESFKIYGANFASLTLQYIALSILLLYINISAAFFTFGAGVVFSVPATCLLLACVKLVNHYNFTKKKYYLDYKHIVTEKEFDEDGKYLDGIDIK